MTKLWLISISLTFFAVLPAACLAAPPEVNSLFPAGVQRGATAAVTANGRFDAWPVRIWVEQDGLNFKPLAEKGKLEVQADANARPGLYWIRFYDNSGSAALKPFLVGNLPELLEQEPNDDPRSPQRLNQPATTINGVLSRSGDVDGFAVRLRRGQTLVASVEANRRLGSPMDGVLQVVSEDGFVLAQNDDAPHLDPELVFHPPADGIYIVRLFAFPATPNSSIGFSGGDRFVYRLTLATSGFVHHTLPLAVADGDVRRLELVGWNIERPARFLNVHPIEATDDGSGGPSLLTVHRPDLANTVQVRVESHETMLEAEPNEDGEAQAIRVPTTITGRINVPGDADVYEFAVEKDERLRVTVESRSLGFLLDPALRLADAEGKRLAEADDVDRNNRDATLVHAFPQGGRYQVEVRDANRFGGVRYAYRLRVVPVDADFKAKLSAERFTLSLGQPLEIPVTIEPLDGFSGEVTVAAVDLPQGVAADPVNVTVKSGGKNGGAVKATLRLARDAQAKSGPFRIVARTTAGRMISRSATALIPGFATATTSVWLTVETK